MPRTTRDWIIVLWPAFVAACLIEMLVFAGFDPHDMNVLGFRVEAGRDTVYSVAFFAFWFVTTLVALAVWSLMQQTARGAAPAAPVGSDQRLDKGHDMRADPRAGADADSPESLLR